VLTDPDTRQAILALYAKGHGVRTISASLGVSRNTVRRIVRTGASSAKTCERASRLAAHDARIRELFAACEGSRQRTHEELARAGVQVPYATLTRYCRDHGIGVVPKTPAGQYVFLAGEEMQHDTSPHRVRLGGREVKLECASVVLCYARRRYAQLYPRWTRFWVKVFLTEAFVRFGGAAGRCMVDNSHVVLAGGSGANAVIAPEMVAFGKRFGFHFAAHEKGDANRSAHVERGFDYVQRNFYPGRTFADLDDANRQLIAWCDQDDQRARRRLGGARPIDLFVAEAPALRPLPLYVPEPTLRWDRTVDIEGYVNLHTNRYSVPPDLVEHEVVVLETKDRVRIFKGQVERCAHARLPDGGYRRAMLPEHHALRRGARIYVPNELRPEEARLSAASPVLGTLCAALRQRHGGRGTRALRRLDRMWKDYPTAVLVAAVERALAHGLYDLERIEQMVLRRIAGDYFQLPLTGSDGDDMDDSADDDDSDPETPT
jgi:transposase